MYRVGGGFPDITIKGPNASNIAQFEAEGRFADLSARTYFVHGEDQELEFKGASGVVLNPAPYFEASLEQISVGSRIPKAMLRGAQAGALTGSEVNEREYGRFISAEQSMVQPVIEELIDRLIITEQIAFQGEYRVDWVSPFELTEQDKANIEHTKASTNAMKLQYMTVDEVRRQADEGVDDLPNGQGAVVPGLQKSITSFMPNVGDEPEQLEAETYMVTKFKKKAVEPAARPPGTP
jgi:hypothetical protein